MIRMMKRWWRNVLIRANEPHLERARALLAQEHAATRQLPPLITTDRVRHHVREQVQHANVMIFHASDNQRKVHR